MAVDAQIKFTQGVTVGVAGEALEAETGTLVQVENGDNTDVVNWTLTLISVPYDSALVAGELASGSDGNPQASFTPDVAGPYGVQLDVSGAGTSSSQQRVLSVPYGARLWHLPAFDVSDANAHNLGGHSRNWAGAGVYKQMDAILREIHDELGAGGGGGYDQIQEDGGNLTQRTTLDFVGSFFTASDTGSKTQVIATGNLGSTNLVTTGSIIGGALLQGNQTVNDANAGFFTLRKSRAGGAVQPVDWLGSYRFEGWDGSTYQQTARIVADVPSGSSVSAGSVPTRVRIQVGNASAGLRTALEATATGTILRLSADTDVATAGDIRTGSSLSIVGRDSGASDDFSILTFGSDTITLGDPDYGADVVYVAGAGNVHKFNRGATTYVEIGEGTLDFLGASGDGGMLRNGDPVLAANLNGSALNAWFFDSPSSWNSGDRALFLGGATTAPSTTDAAGAYLWADATDRQVRSHRFLAREYMGFGTTTLPGSGMVRLPNLGEITFRSSTGLANPALYMDGSNVLQLNAQSHQLRLSASGGITHANGVTCLSTLSCSASGNTTTLSSTGLTFAANANDYVISQASTAAIVGRTLIIQAQNHTAGGIGGNLTLTSGTGGTLGFVRIAIGAIAAMDFVTSHGALASSGSVRVGHGWSLRARNQGNSDNSNLISYGVAANDVLVLGDGSVNQGIQYQTAAGGSHVFSIDGTGYLSLAEGVADFFSHDLTAGSAALSGELSIQGGTSYTFSDTFTTTDATPEETTVFTPTGGMWGFVDVTLWISGIEDNGGNRCRFKRVGVYEIFDDGTMALIGTEDIGTDVDTFPLAGAPVFGTNGTNTAAIVTTTGLAATNIVWSLKVSVDRHEIAA